MIEAIDIADAIVDDLNSQTFSAAFTAARWYVPDFRVEDIGSLTVAVVPATGNSERLARGDCWSETFGVDVAVMRRLDTESTLKADADAVMTLAKEIRNRVRNQTYASSVCASMQLPSNLFRTDHLQEQRVLTTVMRFDFYLGVNS